MSLWRWTLHSSFKPLHFGFWALLAFSAVGIPRAAWAEDPASLSAGPVSAEEAKVLWKDGKDAFDHGLDEDAIPKLERFVARYAGYPAYFEARHVLAQAYLRQHEPAKAKPELKAFIQGGGKSTETLKARCELARADLELKLYSEALLAANEALRLAIKAKKPELQAQALILRARAQIGLGQDAHAVSSVASAVDALPTPAPASLQGQAGSVELELKLRLCARFPSSGKLEEAQVRDQLGRRGSCLLDSLLVFKKVLATDDSSSISEDEERVSQAYASYWESCRHPPKPAPLKPKDRDAQQLKTYFRELAVVLEDDCRQKIRRGLDLIHGWGTSVEAELEKLK